jgi:transcriptional regulator with XRE-family HTH domain
MDFRSRLREEIENSGLLDKEVAARANITKCAIDSYVGGRGCIPSADVAVRLAQVLNTTVEYLVTGSSPVQKITNDKEIKNIVSKLIHFSEKDLSIINSVVDGLDEKYS